MKKSVFNAFIIPFLILFLTGFKDVSAKSLNLSIIYASAALLSLILLVICIILVCQKRQWFIMLFSSVFIVNVGYTILALSNNLQAALWANRLSYLGSVFLPLSMLMIILNVTNTVYKKNLSKMLLLLAVVIFFIAASPGVLDIYYKDVSFQIINGVASLVKVYGILHPIYLFYLLGYFTAMVIVILRAQFNKAINSTAHAIVLAIAVLVNIGVWFTEQLVSIDFEILSVSYIISELFLLGVHLVVKENQRLRDIVNQVENAKVYYETPKPISENMLEKSIVDVAFAPEQIELFMKGMDLLTPTEKAIFDAYISRVTTKEIMATLNIKENTLKYHNKNIYGKLGVSSRKELLEMHKQIKSVKATLEHIKSKQLNN